MADVAVPTGTTPVDLQTRSESESSAAQEIRCIHPSQLVDGSQLNGVVTRVHDSFGFVRCTGISEEIFFHISALTAPPQAQQAPHPRPAKQDIHSVIAVGNRVNLVVGRDHRDRAARNNPADARTIAVRVTVTSRKPSPAGAADGVSSSAATVQPSPTHQGVPHSARGRHPAPVPLHGSQGKRELGTVTRRKEHFGFIKCCSRLGDLFFHISAVDGGQDSPRSPGPGDDVEFSVGIDPKTKQKVAYDLKVVPKGTAVFDSIAEEVLTGTVLQRLIIGKDYTVMSSGIIEYINSDGLKEKLPFYPHGLEAARVNPIKGEKVTFRVATDMRLAAAAAAAEGPAKEAVLKMPGRHAVQVSPVRYTGRVAEITDSTGFIFCAALPTAADEAQRWERKPVTPAADPQAGALPAGQDNAALGLVEVQVEGTPDGSATDAAKKGKHKKKEKLEGRFHAQQHQRMVFFNLAEVEDGKQVHVGSEVEFLLSTKEGQGKVARRVRIKSKAPHMARNERQANGQTGASPVADTPTERPRLFIAPPKKSGDTAAAVKQYVPKCPDGTKGFTFARGRALRPPAGQAVTVVGGMLPLHDKVHALERRMSSGPLNPTAPAFIPRSISSLNSPPDAAPQLQSPANAATTPAAQAVSPAVEAGAAAGPAANMATAEGGTGGRVAQPEGLGADAGNMPVTVTLCEGSQGGVVCQLQAVGLCR